MTKKKFEGLNPFDWMGIMVVMIILILVIVGITAEHKEKKNKEIDPAIKCFEDYAKKYCTDNNLNFSYSEQNRKEKITVFACKTQGYERNGTKGELQFYYFTSAEREDCLA